MVKKASRNFMKIAKNTLNVQICTFSPAKVDSLDYAVCIVWNSIYSVTNFYLFVLDFKLT